MARKYIIDEDLLGALADANADALPLRKRLNLLDHPLNKEESTALWNNLCDYALAVAAIEDSAARQDRWYNRLKFWKRNS